MTSAVQITVVQTDLGPVLSGYQVVMRPIEEDDLETLRCWRNDEGVSQFMVSQSLISVEQQQAWFKKILRDNSQMHFAITYKDKIIGSANIKCASINGDIKDSLILEPGLYIGDEKYRNNIIAFSPTLLLNDYCFDFLKCTKLVAIVKADNKAALNYNAKLGYQVVKQDELMEIQLDKSAYHAQSKTLKALLSRN